ncbi:MAG TPA: hypothetical protein VMJ75_22410 [Candidatus Acidoferrales bacterium]|nr:hypothetical protein [Candidatus Acidoferrales bacterium]
MAASTIKKVLVRRYDRETLAGHVNPAVFLQPEGLELVTAQGNTLIVPFPDVKSVAFVREFESAAPERQVFQTRPKMPGLWVSLTFRDGDRIEGIVPNNLLLLDPAGITVTPPDPFGNQQRIFVPRTSLTAVEVLGVVGSPLKKRKVKPTPKEQIGLFEE